MSDTLYWIDYNGIQHQLTQQPNLDVLWGKANLFMTPVSYVEHQTPGVAGSVIHFPVIAPRDIQLPLIISNMTASAKRTYIRQILGWFNPVYGNGILRVLAPDGSQRDLNCIYSGGLHVDESQGFITYQELPLTLHAADPYFYDSSYTTDTFSQGAPVNFFGSFPLQLSSSGVFGNFSIAITGEVESWPIWQITGPGATPILQNTAIDPYTGLSTVWTLQSSLTLTAGQVLTIDTRPWYKTVKLQDGSNQMTTLTTTSTIWSLQPGNNAITLSMTGTNGSSQIQVQYKNRYQGA